MENSTDRNLKTANMGRQLRQRYVNSQHTACNEISFAFVFVWYELTLSLQQSYVSNEDVVAVKSR